jgi:hypothetical protein
MTTERLDALHDPSTTPGYAGHKSDHLSRLTKVEGHLR